MFPYMPWGEEAHSQHRAAFQEGERLGSGIGGIGSNARRGLIYLSESDNFLQIAQERCRKPVGDVVSRRTCQNGWTTATSWRLPSFPKLDSLHRSQDNFRGFLVGALLAP